MQSSLEGNDNKPEVILSFYPEKMKEKNFLNDTIDIFRLKTNVGNPSVKMLDGVFKVHTSWEGCSAATIQGMTQVSITDNIWRAPIRISSFPHYVAIISFLIESWLKQDMQATDFVVGKFTIQMRPNDLYCCPIKKYEKDMNLNDKRLSYATLKTSRCFNKKYSETVWFYMNGNHDKVNSYIQTPQDAIALCAVLFSEVIRYPDMFFHNILLMQHLKSWEDFHDQHPMLTGGSWKGGSRNRGQVIVPEKVKQREVKNLVSYIKKIISHMENRGTICNRGIYPVV
ncbi:hypothetical protein QQF64_025963 [Cirrhinus molitorella]|uniref:Uncharacterized protein n=1 Tax=Cirrhinus molitorella TaxID=172907 RepID=A0ABR3NQX5_9TELE